MKASPIPALAIHSRIACFEHFATCNYQPDIPDAGAYEIWVENKAPTAEQRANWRWKEMLKSYEMPPINPEIDAALCDFIARKKESMPDA